MRTFAVLPVKRFDRAKQRLGPGLDAGARGRLAQAMLRDVLGALARVRALRGIVLVSGEQRAQALAQRYGATVVDDRYERGQSAAARAGIACALSRGAERALLIPGDCPRASAAELERLLASRSEAATVTIVPDRHGLGTNALLVSPPGVIDPSFGAGSFERHLTAARAAGATVSVERPPSLALDIDTGADLDALRASLAGDEGVAAHTRRVLDSLAEGTPLSFARP